MEPTAEEGLPSEAFPRSPASDATAEEGLPSEVRGARLCPERIVGKYVLVTLLGRGGMGEVWKAWDGDLSRWVAIKFLLAGSEDDVRRFQREAQSVAALSHPNIAAVYEVGEHAGRRYIAMQFIEGETLDDARAPLKRRIEALRDAARAVQYAHEHGIIHRDLKPANMILDKAGRIFILDFGLARSFRGDSNLSLSGMIIGTPAYMPPEQADGRLKDLGPRSDVYSLGATLYALATGRAPFEAETAADIPYRVVHEDPPSPRSLKPSLPADLATIIRKAMEKEPQRRYATASEFADDLQRFLDGEPISARAPSLLYRFRRQLARRRTLVRTAAVSTVLAAAAMTVLVVALTRAGAFESSRRAAQAAHAAGDWARALAECDRALALRADPELSALAEDCRRRIDGERRHRELLDRFRPLEVLIKETRPFFYIRDIDIREKLDAVERSLDQLQAVAAASEGRPEPWAILGMGWHFVGDSARAEEALLKTHALAPDDAAVNHFLGRIYLERALLARIDVEGEPEKGAPADAPLSEKALSHLKRAKSEDELDRLMAEGYVAMAEGSAVRIRAIAREGLDRFGKTLGSEEFWNLLGCVADGEERMGAFTRALERRPHFPWARFMRGTERHGSGDLEGADSDLTAAIRMNPRWFAPYHNRALVRHNRGDAEGALADHAQAIRLNPDSAALYVSRATTLQALGRLDEAMADCERALALNPASANAYLNRGATKVLKGDLPSALRDADEALRINPRLVTAYVNRSSWRKAAGDYDGAIADCDEALRIAPRLVEALNNRGTARQAKGELDAAVSDFSAAVRINPNYPEGYANRAYTLSSLGRTDEAVADYLRALEVAPPSWPHRAEVQRRIQALRQQ